MIKKNVGRILSEIPEQVTLVAASKKRSVVEIEEAICAGIKVVGENYVSEAQPKFKVIGNKVRWHLIGHLQKNKVKKAVKIFDLIESLDSKELAIVLNQECVKINKVMPVLIEVNSAREEKKSGVLVEDIDALIEEVLKLDNLKLMGLMTMGPLLDDPESIRPFFKKTKQVFDRIGNLKYLSMGMSDSYKVAIEEGANIVRIGTGIFGPR